FIIVFMYLFFFFFFQAEDGIRDRNVTGVQTCALPISPTSPTSPVGSIDTSRVRSNHRASCSRSMTLTLSPFFASVPFAQCRPRHRRSSCTHARPNHDGGRVAHAS